MVPICTTQAVTNELRNMPNKLHSFITIAFKDGTIHNFRIFYQLYGKLLADIRHIVNTNQIGSSLARP